MTDLRFPVGKFVPRPSLDSNDREKLIDSLATSPSHLSTAIANLSPAQLDTAYRPQGWTVRQVVHHLADSHMNSYIRFRFALTEEKPTIKPYDENLWANLTDAAHADPNLSLQLLDGLHQRWVILLRSMTADDFARTLIHPEHGELSLDIMLQLYEWHGRHHVAHINELRKRQEWI